MELIWIEMCVKSNKKLLVGGFVAWVYACWMHHLETSHCFIPAPEGCTLFQQRILLRAGTGRVGIVFVRSAFVSLGIIWIWSAIQRFLFSVPPSRTHYHRDWPVSNFAGRRLSRNSVVSSSKFCDATWNQIPGARTLWQLNFVRRRLIFVGPQRWTFFMSHLWRQKFGSGC